MSTYPPDLNTIPDTPQESYWVKQCLRWLADRTNELRGKLDATPPPASTSSLKDLERRVGVLERRIPGSVLAYGRWRQTTELVGAGSFAWDTEDLNVGGFTRISSEIRVVVPFSGVVVVIADLLLSAMVGTDASVELHHNSPQIRRGYAKLGGTAFSPSVSVSAVQLVQAGDYFECKNTAFNRYGDADRYTALTIFRIA